MTFIKIALVDDHKLFRKGLISLIEMVNKEHTILFEADNGIDLQTKLNPKNLPDIIIMDINMPNMNGIESVKWLNKNHPQISVLVVSMIEQEESIVQMLKLGVKGYLGKDVEPQELADALQAIINKGFYYTDFITGKLVHSIQAPDEKLVNKNELLNLLSQREKDFLKLACSESTYGEIAAQMFLSPKTIDGYRNALFEKLNVKTRVGLVMFALKHDLINI